MSESSEWDFTEALVSLIEHVRDRADHEEIVLHQTRVALALTRVGEDIGLELIGTLRDVVREETP